MHKFFFSIKTQGGLPIARLMIFGRDQQDAERKLKQMYHHCEIISCECSQNATLHKKQDDYLESISMFLAKQQESPTGKYPAL